MKCIGVIQKSMICIGLLAVIVSIALIVFRQLSDTPASASSVMEKSAASAKVIETLNQFDKKTGGLAAISACFSNEIHSNDGALWKYILYDPSEDLNKEGEQLVYFASVNASGEIENIGQGWIRNDPLMSNISKNGMFLTSASSYAYVIPNPKEMYFPNTGLIRYFNQVDCIEKDEIQRLEVYDYDPLTKSKSQIKTVSIKKGYFLIDMPTDGESYEWTQEKGWIDKITNKEAKVDSYSWEIFR